MKKVILLLLCAALLLSGCGGAVSEPEVAVETTVPPTTEPAPIRFPDGDPETVACLGSYTADTVSDAVIAQVGEEKLTNRELQVWYWAEVAQFRQSGQTGPDFERPLDQQECTADDDVVTWQQYFLKRALNNWHTAQAMIFQGEEAGVPTEERYAPLEGNYEEYMDGMPATKVLYGYNENFVPNSMHQAYLDGLPEHFAELAASLGYAGAEAMAQEELAADEESLLSYAHDLNFAYMYLTELSYLLEQEEEAAPAGDDALVTFRHILCTGADAQAQAQELLDKWKKSWPIAVGNFASMAYESSQDAGSAAKGGLYQRAAREQLPEELAQWCLDPARKEGDTTVLETAHGAHAVYFLKAESREQVEAEQEFLREEEQRILEEARENHPMKVTYGDIVLKEARGELSKDTLLYADLAHERFPDVPLYLQQDYPGVMYGAFPLRSNGCGITTFAMLVSYMADDLLSPPKMCAEFGRYSFSTGTDSSIFVREVGNYNCFLRQKTYEWQEVKDHMAEGYLAVVLQHKGYWTRGGHYLVLEKMDEDEMVQVRDSNLYNYNRIRAGHEIDRFPWSVIRGASAGYWVFEKKDVTHPACTRCGTEEGQKLCTGYLCEKCTEATLRRDVYLAGT